LIDNGTHENKEGIMIRYMSRRHAHMALLWLCGAWLVLASAPATGDSGIAVSDSGVGTAVVDRELEGAGDSFPEGIRIWFWNRVVGGVEGDRIVHVWLRDGGEVHSIELELGGPDWRTWSYKTLHPGSVGSWAVEARDTDGAVLARHEFRCVPAEETPPAS
jgi:hypothetical protein